MTTDYHVGRGWDPWSQHRGARGPRRCSTLFSNVYADRYADNPSDRGGTAPGMRCKKSGISVVLRWVRCGRTVDKKKTLWRDFLFAKRAPVYELRPWKFCGTSDRGPSRAKKSTEAPRVCCPARGLEPPPAVLEPPELWSRRKAWVRVVEKVLLSLAGVSFSTRWRRGAGPSGASQMVEGTSGAADLSRLRGCGREAALVGERLSGLELRRIRQNTLQTQGGVACVPGRYPAGSDEKCPGRRGWGEVHWSRAIAPVKANDPRGSLALTLERLTGLCRPPQGGRQLIREGNRVTGETRGAREIRGLCSWIVRIAEASERCSVPEASG